VRAAIYGDHFCDLIFPSVSVYLCLITEAFESGPSSAHNPLSGVVHRGPAGAIVPFTSLDVCATLWCDRTFSFLGSPIRGSPFRPHIRDQGSLSVAILVVYTLLPACAFVFESLDGAPAGRVARSRQEP